jgi:hypothetical protein
MPDVTIDAVVNSARMAVQGSDVATPASGFVQVYPKSDGIYLRGSDGVVYGPFVSANRSFSGDVLPKSVALGLAARFINKGRTPTTHFTSASIPSGYAWLTGGVFAAPTSPGYLEYNYSGDFLIAAMNAASVKGFLYKSVGNVGSKWQNRSLMGRFAAGVPTEIGLRLDNGTDSNYAEIYMTGVLANGMQRVDFRYSASGTVTPVQSSMIAPITDSFVLQLYCQYIAPSTYVLHGFVVGEEGLGFSITGFSINSPAWVPSAGRAGLMVHNYGSVGRCDWLLNEFES